MTTVTTPSLFQTLPPDIIEHIVDDIIAGHKPLYGSQKPIGLAIAHTCIIWRSVFIKRAGQTLSFKFGPYDNTITFLNCPAAINPLDYPITKFVKTIKVDIRVNTVVADGSALAMLKSIFSDDVVFSSVRAIIYDLNMVRSFAECASTPHTDRDCFHHFFQHICKIAPNIHSADINWNKNTWGSDKSRPEYDIEGAISKLLCGIKEVKYMGNSKRSSPVKLNLESISELVCIDIELGSKQDNLLQIIRNNAPSLRTVKLVGLQKSSIKHLLFNEASDPVVYPELQSLVFNECYERRDYRGATEPSQFIHFPALKRLDFMPLCPFLSNLVYNCHSSELESLSILIEGPGSLFELSYQPFKSSSFNNLQTLNFFYGQTKRTGVSGASYVLGKVARDFAVPVLNSTTSIRKVRLDGRMIRYHIFENTSTCQWLHSVKMLNILEIEFDLSDIILLLQNAPHLYDLGCSLKSGIPSIDGISKGKLPNHVKTQLFPISSSLFKFRGLCGKYCSNLHLAYYFLLLTIGCPNLSIIGSSSFISISIMPHVKNLANTKPFADYTEAVEKLASIVIN